MKKLLVLLVLFIPSIASAFTTSATSAILMDMDNNIVIYSENPHQVRSVASISKIMTAIVAIESGKLDEDVTVGDEILKAYGSGIYIKQGEILKLRDLVYGLMLRSGNDAALAIATYVGGDLNKFVNLMNDKAKEIGMKNTVFKNPHGLDNEGGNMSSAYDMALLTSYAMKNADYKEIVKTKKYNLKTNLNTYSWQNKNKLLKSYQYTTGGKTGFTEIAKRTLVTTASKDGLNLVAVTLNDGNDFLDHKNLFDEAFKKYASVKILSAGEITIIDEKYYQNASFYLKNSYTHLIDKSVNNNALLQFELEKKANYQTDDMIGKVKVIVNGNEVHEESVYIKVQQKISFLEKIKAWFKNL